MAGLSLGNCDQSGFRRVELSLQDEASQESHAGELDDSMSGKVCSRSADAELVLAECGLGRGLGDGLVEDAGVTSLVVTDLYDPLIRCTRVFCFLEGRLIERLYAILVEGIDGPLGAQEVLEENVVSARRAFFCRENWLGVVARKWWRCAVVRGVIGRLRRNWPKVRVVESGA